MTTQTVAADKIPSNLRALRKRLGLTQTEVGARVGMNQQTYSKYESGDLRLRVDMLPGLAAALECLVDEILVDIEDRRIPLSGAIEAGGKVTPLDLTSWDGPKEVDCPRDLNSRETEAYVVLSDALLPIEQGSIIFAQKPAPVGQQEIIGRLCVVVLTNGHRLVKQVRRGYSRGHFNLVSASVAPIEDAPVELAGVVKLIEARKLAQGAA